MSTIRARVKPGALRPLEKSDLAEGSEVTITIVKTGAATDPAAAIRSAAGACKGPIDAKKLVRDIYRSRRALGPLRRPR